MTEGGGLNRWLHGGLSGKACEQPPEKMTESMAEDRGRMADFLNLHPNLNTRTRHLMAETRDLKTDSPRIIRPPVSL